MNLSTPGLAPSDELGPQSCYQRITWSKATMFVPDTFPLRVTLLGLEPKNCLFWPIFRENKPSPFAQPLHCVRILLACNSSLSLSIDAKFSHNVQMSTKSRKFRGSPNLGVKGDSHAPNFFREKTFFRKKNWGGSAPPPIFFVSRKVFLDANIFL